MRLLILPLILVTFVASANEVKREALQAAFIYKFTNYIEWPEDSALTFNVGVLDNPEMMKALEEVFHEKSVGTRKVQVTPVEKLDGKTHFHILHLHRIDKKTQDELKNLKVTGVLVISHDEEKLLNPASINFRLGDEGKLRFEIDNDRAVQSSLKINSRLLNLARGAK